MFSAQSLELFKTRIRGKVIQAESVEYDSARKIFNGMIDKHPAVIVRCSDLADVIVSVNFARENQLLTAIRGGGHNVGGLGVCEDGLVIDLSAMNNVTVDPLSRTVRVEGGCTLADMDHATQATGLIVPSGVFSSTGVGGLTLGGGLGHLTRKYGLAIDNLLEANMVLADGSYVKASKENNEDLFWAICGGGGNFGVVTSFLFKAYPLTTVFGGPMFWFMEDAGEILKWYRQVINSAPDSVNGFFAFLGIPPNDHFPPELHLKKMCAIIWCCSGDEQEANRFFQSARNVKAPVIDGTGLMPFVALQKLFDPIVPYGTNMYWKGDFINELTDEAISEHLRIGLKLPNWQCGMHLYPINGAASRVGKNDTAWNHRDATWAMVIPGADSDPSDRKNMVRWVKEYWKDLHPYSAGASYVNFMGEEEPDAVKASYGEHYERLRKIKTKYDPNNFFRINQNIPPL